MFGIVVFVNTMYVLSVTKSKLNQLGNFQDDILEPYFLIIICTHIILI